MATGFSNSGEDVIQRCIKTPQMDITGVDVDIKSAFEIDETSQWIKQNGFCKVALQFSDELMSYSVDVVQLLSKETSAILAILADTSYGSCCVDEVSAEHYQVNALVHYGHACLSPVQRLPVFYVFGRHPLDATDCISQLESLLSDISHPILLLYDVVYHRSISAIEPELSRHFPNLKLPDLDLPQASFNADKSSQCCHTETSNLGETQRKFVRFGRRFELTEEHSIEDHVLIFIGSESLFQNAVMMTFNRCCFVSYDPETKTGKSNAWNMNRQLMKRYYLVEKARDAERVGILVGTLGVNNYLDIIKCLSSLISSAGKKCYKFVVGKLNIAKLANFAEIDVYVLVACPENSLIDSSEMYRPVVTPFEMEIACDADRHWTGDYELDFRQLLPGGLSYHQATSNYQTQMDVSLITGKVRRFGIVEEEEGRNEKTNGSKDGTLVISNDEIAMRGSAGEFLGNRLWQGLDPQLGKTAVVKAIRGTKGTATGYETEPATTTS